MILPKQLPRVYTVPWSWAVDNVQTHSSEPALNLSPDTKLAVIPRLKLPDCPVQNISLSPSPEIKEYTSVFVNLHTYRTVMTMIKCRYLKQWPAINQPSFGNVVQSKMANEMITALQQLGIYMCGVLCGHLITDYYGGLTIWKKLFGLYCYIYRIIFQ